MTGIQKCTKKNISRTGGELRYLEFITVLYSEAKFILLDEPFILRQF
jgi:ABC-type lipopolysaccharide export system ATPase subunit